MFVDRGDNEDEPLESCFQELLDVKCNDYMPRMSAVLVKPVPGEYDCGDFFGDDYYDYAASDQESVDAFWPANGRDRSFLMDTTVDKDGWILNYPKFHAILRETSWSAELSSCLKKLNLKKWGQAGKDEFLKHAAAHCLAESAKRFILPQNREGALERSDMVVTMETLDQLLVTSKLRYAYSLFSILYSCTHSLHAHTVFHSSIHPLTPIHSSLAHLHSLFLLPRIFHHLLH